MLPLSVMISMTLLLGTLSLLASVLQARLRISVEQRLRQTEDSLITVAHELMATIQARHPCLLSVGQEQWLQAGCASASDIEGLQHGIAESGSWTLVSWQPASSQVADLASGPGMEFALQYVPSIPTSSPMGARFSFDRASSAAGISALRFRGRLAALAS